MTRTIHVTETKTASFQEPVGEATAAKISIAVPFEHATVRALDAGSDNLFAAEVEYIGEMLFDVDQEGNTKIIRLKERVENLSFDGDDPPEWAIGLSPDIPIDLALVLNSGAMEADLRNLRLTGLDVKLNSGHFDLTLPQDTNVNSGRIHINSGRFQSRIPGKTTIHMPSLKLNSGRANIQVGENATFQLQALKVNSGKIDFDLGANTDFALPSIQMNSGKVSFQVGEGIAFTSNLKMNSGTLTLHVPDQTGVQIDVRAYMSGDIHVPKGFTGKKIGRGQEIWQSAGFDEAEQQIRLKVKMTSGNIVIRKSVQP